VLIAGVDLAAEPKGTAMAIVEWTAIGAKLISLQLGVTDNLIVEASATIDKLGIDCPLGWPIEFVDFVSSHNDLDSKGHEVDGGMGWRRRLSFRETDRAVRERTGRWPLSVATDRLGLTAMRCAGLLRRLERSGVQVDRSGIGSVVEVYPGATLRLWGFDTTGYRSSKEARKRLLSEILDQAKWLDVVQFAPLMIKSCDAFDAVIASLSSRAVTLGLYEPPTGSQLRQARVEGWIALPTGKIQELVSPTSC